MKILLLAAAALALAGCETPRPRPVPPAPGGETSPCPSDRPIQGDAPIGADGEATPC